MGCLSTWTCQCNEARRDERHRLAHTWQIDPALLPPLAITEVHVVANIAARDDHTVQEGDVAVVNDDSLVTNLYRKGFTRVAADGSRQSISLTRDVSLVAGSHIFTVEFWREPAALSDPMLSLYSAAVRATRVS